MEEAGPKRTRELIRTDGASQGAPFCAAAVYGEMVWTSGALPVEDDGTVPTDFVEQVRLALANLRRSLQSAGADWSSVLKINGYISDIEWLPQLNRIYREVVDADGLPARTTVEVPRFRNGVHVEFDAVAHLILAGGK